MRAFARLAIAMMAILLAGGHPLLSDAGELPSQDDRRYDSPPELPVTSAIRRPIAPKENEGTLHSITFSPDGKSVAASNIFGVVKVFDAGAGRQISLIKPEEGAVLAGFPIAFSPSGQALAAPSPSGQWTLFDPATAKKIRVMDPHPGVVDRTVRTAVAFSPDGKRLAGCYATGEVVIWDLATGRRVRVLPPYIMPAWREPPMFPGGTETNAPARPQAVSDLVFAPDSATLYTSARVIRAWDINANVDSRRFDLPAGLPCGCVAITPDGTTLAVAVGYANAVLPYPATESRFIALIDVISGRKKAEIVIQTDGIQGLAFLPGGRVLVSLDREGVIRLWDVTTAKPIAARRFDNHFRVNSLAISPDGRRIAAAGYSSNQIFGVIGMAETDGVKINLWKPIP